MSNEEKPKSESLRITTVETEIRPQGIPLDGLDSVETALTVLLDPNIPFTLPSDEHPFTIALQGNRNPDVKKVRDTIERGLRAGKWTGGGPLDHQEINFLRVDKMNHHQDLVLLTVNASGGFAVEAALAAKLQIPYATEVVMKATMPKIVDQINLDVLVHRCKKIGTSTRTGTEIGREWFEAHKSQTTTISYLLGNDNVSVWVTPGNLEMTSFTAPIIKGKSSNPPSRIEFIIRSAENTALYLPQQHQAAAQMVQSITEALMGRKSS